MTIWIPVIVASLSALGAVVAAAIAGRSAGRTKKAEIEASRIVELERRVSISRAEIFEPMVAALLRVWDLTSDGQTGDADAFEEAAGADIRRFMHWVQIYGSDEAVRVSLRFMQAIYHSPPPNIVMRLIGELIVVARRELGYPETDITALEVLGMRITDVYTDPEIYADLTQSLPRVFARYDWTPPWTFEE